MPQLKHIDPGPDCISLLLTTDNHVGYNEVDPIRGDDGWKTFHKIMEIAVERDVDMVIQGGDLFHTNKPSKKSMYYVMKTLRETCMGDKPFQLELVSDPSDAMCNKSFNYPNFEDPNINVSIPVFGISGNHDDATGDDLLSPMDLLAVGGLFNHFGKVNQNDIIHISPLLFRKGSSNLALYGMASVRDERLYRTFRDGHVTFSRPNEDNWFNLMCVHQNRTQYSGTDYLPEVLLPNFLDFILWGHEHECIPYTSTNPDTGFHVLQPGSSLATSLGDSEYEKKHVFILNIKGKDFSLEPIPLTSVRPFETQSVVLSDTGLLPNDKGAVLNYLIEQVDKLIERANNGWVEANSDPDPSSIPLPLIRLKVEYSGGYDVENPRRFSNRFVGRVANVNDVVIFHRKKVSEGVALTTSSKSKLSAPVIDSEMVNELVTDTSLDISELVNRTLQDDDLILLQKTDMNKVIDSTITQEDKNILKSFVEKELDKDLKLLLSLNIGEDESESAGVDYSGVKKSFRNLVKELRAKTAYGERSPTPESGKKKKTRKSAISDSIVHSDTDDMDGIEPSNVVAVPQRSVRSLGASSTHFDADLDVEDQGEIVQSDSGDEYVPEPKPTRNSSHAKKAVSKPSKAVSSDSDEELIDIPAPKKTKAPRKAGTRVSAAAKAAPEKPKSIFGGLGRR